MVGKATKEQIENWKTDLASAIDDEEWQQALKFCSWLRYALDEEDQADTKVEQMHHLAKTALAEQMGQERAQRGREKTYRRLQYLCTQHIASGKWMSALDSIILFYEHGASQEEIVHLLQTLKVKLSAQLASKNWRESSQGTAIKQRFNQVVNQVRNNS